MRATRLTAAVCVVLSIVVGPIARPAQAGPKWAAASVATIHPGVQTRTPAGQCTGNFIFYDKKDLYIGQAGHCSSKGGPTDTNGCTTPLYPVGTRVRIEGASKAGVVVYDSWATMQKNKEKSLDVCHGNDFALVRINKNDRAKVNPTIPFWGGPMGIDRTSTFGKSAYSYGDSELRGGIAALSPKFGFSTSDDYNGWTHGVVTITPGIFGDSGSAIIGPTGGALAVLSTFTVFGGSGLPLQSNGSDLFRDLAYMRKYTPSLRGVTLANGTAPFAPLL